jgi:polar amino acid transport system substrate-binding protein
MSPFTTRRGLAAGAGLLMAAAGTTAAEAQEAATGLDALLKRGKVAIATDLSAPPFGLQDKDMQPAGADIDVSNLLAKDLGLKLETVQVNSANRIPYLLTKRVDFVISSFSITPERAKSVTFSIPFGGMSSILVASKDQHITGYGDLVGKKISVSRGTTNETDMIDNAPKGAQVVRFDDEASAQAALVAGQVDAYVTGEILTRVFSDRNPQLKLESKFVLRNVFFSVGMRRGDPDLARWIDIWIMCHKESGEFGKIYTQWLGHALPTLPVF